MTNEQLIGRLNEIILLSRKMSFSEENLVEILSYYKESLRVFRDIKSRKVKTYCVKELREMETDEYGDLIKYESKSTDGDHFKSFKYEFICVLEDCISHISYPR